MSLDDLGAAAWADDTEPEEDVWAAEPGWGANPAQKEQVTELQHAVREDEEHLQQDDEDDGFGAFDAPGTTSPLALAAPEDDDFGDFGDFEDVEQDVAPTFTEEPASVWQDPSRPPPLVSSFPARTTLS